VQVEKFAAAKVVILSSAKDLGISLAAQILSGSTKKLERRIRYDRCFFRIQFQRGR
jgi:hypothetical protein